MLWIRICICMCTCVCVFIYIYVMRTVYVMYVSIWVSSSLMLTQIMVFVCVYSCTYTCTIICSFIIRMCVYIYMYVCKYPYICQYIICACFLLITIIIYYIPVVNNYDVLLTINYYWSGNRPYSVETNAAVRARHKKQAILTDNLVNIPNFECAVKNAVKHVKSSGYIL